ncbi:hypothetical protein DER45DRAFT_94250 [Fusarium avenaceum]|nr:hypothetical protein DER45DRAFT_94250 [Fusarium avenaceum]
MEGLSSPYYWQWKQTIGDLKLRPGRLGTWGDIKTDGFGTLEQMQMAQDFNVTVVLGVWAGIYLDGKTVPKSELRAYVDEAKNLLDFLTVRPLIRRLGLKDADRFFAQGFTSSTYGAKRAALGYTSPFVVGCRGWQWGLP